MTAHPMRAVADELDVSWEDVLVVAQIELDGSDYDEEDETLTDNGRRLVLQHFRGGVDPD